jgi:transglutaminase superfamily protein
MELRDLEVLPQRDETAIALAAPPTYEVVALGTFPRLRFATLPDWREDRFVYSKQNEPYLERLRRQYDLDEAIRDRDTDLERVRALCTWTHGRWQHSSDGRPKASDPITILEQASGGGRFRCVEYATVLHGCLNAVGIAARTVNLLPRDIETSYGGAGHMVVEAFLPDADAWVFADPQFDAVATVDGEPAHAVALAQALAAGGPVDFGPSLTGSLDEYKRFVGERLVYFRTWLDQRTGTDARAAAQLMLVPIGYPEPRVFERTLRIEGCEYTHALPAFYGAPASSG